MHSVAVGHVRLVVPLPIRTTPAALTCLVVGSNVRAFPAGSTDVHCVVETQDTATWKSPLNDDAPAGATCPVSGLNGTSTVPTATQTETLTQETDPRYEFGSTFAVFATVPEPGSKVTSTPALSTAVHCDADGQSTEDR